MVEARTGFATAVWPEGDRGDPRGAEPGHGDLVGLVRSLGFTARAMEATGERVTGSDLIYGFKRLVGTQDTVIRVAPGEGDSG